MAAIKTLFVLSDANCRENSVSCCISLALIAVHYHRRLDKDAPAALQVKLMWHPNQLQFVEHLHTDIPHTCGKLVPASQRLGKIA